jgi:hypothetical protein
MMRFSTSLLTLACISALAACTAGRIITGPDLLAGHQAGLPQQATQATTGKVTG